MIPLEPSDVEVDLLSFLEIDKVVEKIGGSVM